ncbi:FAD-dependent oxidoreductase [Desulfitibacter alkalitolerans]|uniref:FAD-dependent oxidoreductase n=1 Tax=Desulfitibacter alkalitolerans TaxID=264641 RepID=UPI000485D023
MTEKFDVIVVGAGPAGISTALLTARAGLNTILIERGDFPGSKNVMGGVLYRHPTEQIVPGFYKAAPLERHIIEQRLWILDKDSAVTLGYKTSRHGSEPYNAFTVLRARFDRWLADKAVEAGALLITETVVEDLIIKNEKVIGVRTGRPQGDVYGNVVVLAEGVNSMLTQKAGLKKDRLKTTELAVAVKEVIALPKEKIEDRFNLEQGQGVTIELVGESTRGMVGTGFIYTNTDSISVGVGALLSQVVRREVNPNDLLEHLKNHPLVKPLLVGGETKEYLGHMIPEGGYHSIPKLYGSGLLVVGDAAGFVNGIHREGSNMAMLSGKMAAETIIDAHNVGEFDERALSHYEKKLEESFILKDLRKYQNASGFFETHDYFFSIYPQLVNDAAHEFTTIDSIPKKEKQNKIIRDITSRRSKIQLIKDMYRGWRVLG